MDMTYLLSILLFVFGIIVIRQDSQLYSQKKKIETLEKRMYNNLTDFEILVFIIDLYARINFKKLRPDQIKLWTDWIKRLKDN